MPSLIVLRAWCLTIALAVPAWASAQATSSAASPRPVTPGRSAVAKPHALTSTTPDASSPRTDLSYLIAPTPAWVSLVALPSGASAQPAPMHYRIIDEQVRVDTNSVTEFSRVVRVVNQAEGLAVASQIELEFDPSYQKLTLHRLEVVRAGQSIPKLDRKRIQLLQREKQLEQRIYDGRVTASIVIDDVRVGDEIDLSYSVQGANPVFGGKFVHNTWMMSQRGPAQLIQVRLLAPASRVIRHAVGPTDATVTSQLRSGMRETVFTRKDVAQLRPEAGAPYAALLPEQLQFSEFADWAEVAAWGEGLFRDAAAGQRSAAKAEEIRAAVAAPLDRALEALRFVQQEVRYFGIEIGPSTHRPNPADRVMEQRFGDCKDKVTLLSALLRGLDVPVRPVLVSVRLRDQVDRVLPSPLAFDHVIARIDADGGPLWLDPTRAHQTGSLKARQVVGLGRGLELAPGTLALSTLPAPFDTERMRVEDRLVVDKFIDGAVLESRVVFRGDMAEMMREAIATQSLATVADNITTAYVRAYPKLNRLTPASVQAVTNEDALALTQRFALPEFWRFPEQRALVGDIVPWGVVESLLPPKSESRRQPLAFSMPGIFRHRIRVEFAEDVFSQPSSRRIDDGDAHFSLSSTVDAARNLVEFNTEVRVGVTQVESSQWSAFNAALARTLPKLGGVVAVPAVPLSRVDALGAQARQLEEDLRRQRVKAVTGTQTQSQFKRLALTAQIDGGRLAPALRAQALVARGVASDHLGLLDDARNDFDAALAIDGNAVEALNAAAVNAQGRGDTERAIVLVDQVLKQQPRDSQALGTRALTHYLSGRLKEARVDWEAALADSAALRRGYPLIWLALAARRGGATSGDLAALAEKYPRSSWPTEWPRPLLDTMFDNADEAAVLQAAKGAKAARESQTEAYFYLGEKLAAQGDVEKARDHWKRAVDLGVVEFIEYNAAQQRLRAPR